MKKLTAFALALVMALGLLWQQQFRQQPPLR